MTCVPSVAYEQLVALLDCIDEKESERQDLLLRQRTAIEQQRVAVDKEIQSSKNFTEFAAQLRRQVEAGRVQAESALIELLPRRFSTSEFVSTLHEHSPKRKAS